jgi:hypothetical protein
VDVKNPSPGFVKKNPCAWDKEGYVSHQRKERDLFAPGTERKTTATYIKLPVKVERKSENKYEQKAVDDQGASSRQKARSQEHSADHLDPRQNHRNRIDHEKWQYLVIIDRLGKRPRIEQIKD